ncbi:MAG: hypothetical protein ACAH83_13730 [Alphaproteobacteria bacterium]
MDKDIQEQPPVPPSEAPGLSAPPTPHSAEAPKENPASPKALGFWAGMRARAVTARRRLGTSWHFAKEAWDEHSLWVEAMAVKGGASAIIIGVAVAVSAVAALPFVAAAGVIAVCGALVAVGIIGCAAAGTKTWDSIRGVYARVMGRTPKERPKKESKTLVERLENVSFVKRAMNHRLGQKVLNSRAWKLTQKITKSKEDSFVHSLAVGGALVTLALGTVVLATQVVVLPVIAVGTLATWAVAEVAVCFTSGIYGLYLSGQSIMHKRREKKEALRAAMEKPLHLGEITAPAPIPTKETPATDKPALAETFTEKAQAGNDNAPVPANDTKKQEPDLIAVPASKKPPLPGA